MDRVGKGLRVAASSPRCSDERQSSHSPDFPIALHNVCYALKLEVFIKSLSARLSTAQRGMPLYLPSEAL